MRISVIIPAHDAARTIGQTLRSVFAQSSAPVEVIVVDDGSTDDLAAALRPYQDRVQSLRLPHRGAAAARNAGARLATGDALFFCDADIELEPDAFAHLVEALARDSGAAFAYGAFTWSGGGTLGDRDFDPAAIRRNNFISTMSLIRRDRFPGFDESLARFQDWDLWLTVIERGGRGTRVPRVLFRVLARGSMSFRGGLSRILATARIRAKHHLRWYGSDLWLALKESIKAGRL